MVLCMPLRVNLGKYSPEQLFSRGSTLKALWFQIPFFQMNLHDYTSEPSQWVESGLQDTFLIFPEQSPKFLLLGMNLFKSIDTSQTNAVHNLNWLCAFFSLLRCTFCIFFCPIFYSFSLSRYILVNKASSNYSTAWVSYCLNTSSTKQL